MWGTCPKLVSVLKAMHSNVSVKFDVGGVSKTLNSIIGVKQGDLLGPELFTFFMAAVMETWRATHNYELQRLLRLLSCISDLVFTVVPFFFLSYAASFCSILRLHRCI